MRLPYIFIKKVSCKLVAKVFAHLSVSLSYKPDMGE